MKIRFLLALENRLRNLRRKYAHILYAGKSVYCPMCDQTFRKFKSAGRSKYKRPNSVCPKCAGRERDRVMHLFFAEKKEILRRKQCRLLHIAPEPCVVPNLRDLATQLYVSGDLVRNDVLTQFDIQALPFSDQSFDVVYCSHVLQAVEDDDKALAEISRVLSYNGWAIVNVPCRGVSTREFHAGGDEEAPADFVRIYGSDFTDKLVQKGFNVVPIKMHDIASDEDQRMMCLSAESVGSIYLLQHGTQNLENNTELDE
ncbi:MAG: methyltransferase domain-containing protein [Gammaproteobacteria bacterium]|nr:methyltransferase domain-containing protein [Gammaproteobacteria bacterium]MYC25262.1 methyltransferase domain-containing protein [Gammaproteobacteria bacterium]